jgi:hypothetical protein
VSLTPYQILDAVTIGVGASLLMDGWNFLLKRSFNIPSLDYCLLGRWILHMPDGTFSHPSIGAAPQKRLECPVGWVAHYTIGAILALVFIAVAPADWLLRPTLLPALLYGVGTVVFPFFVLQPSLGLGIASAKTPKPSKARIKSLGTHVVFGVGLYLCAVALRYVHSAA